MSKINITEVSDKDLSPEDIQAQIDAKMDSAVSKKTEVKAEVKVAKASEPKIQKTATKTPIEKAKTEVITKTAPGEPKVTEPAVVSHRGKILNPADAKKDVVVDESGDNSKPSPTDEPAEEKLEVKVENKVNAEDQPKKTPLAPVSERLSSISEEIKEAEAKKEEAKEAKRLEEFPPEIIDTKQYHLPIKTSNRRGKNSVSLTTVLFMVFLLVVALAYIAADKEIYDPGIKLPYDFF